MHNNCARLDTVPIVAGASEGHLSVSWWRFLPFGDRLRRSEAVGDLRQ